MSKRLKLQGTADGTYLSKTLSASHFSATLERLLFFNESGTQVIPPQGTVTLEYQTATDESWFPFDNNAKHDFIRGDHKIASAAGKLIQRIRITLTDFPDNYTFRCSVICDQAKVLQNFELERKTLATIDQFNQVKSVEYTPIIELKSIYGASVLRDEVTTLSGGTVTQAGAELSVAGTAAGDEARLSSAERGRYQSGTIGVAGIGIRVIRPPADANSRAEWGYFNGANGFGFGIDDTGLYTFVERAGVQVKKTYQPSWSSDPLDGTGKSRIDIDPTDGLVYRFPFLWYGYGSINFEVVERRQEGDLTVLADSAQFRGSVSIEDPNLPISARVFGDCEIAVGGRQYGIYGRYEPSRRVVGASRQGVTVTSASTVPLISFRIKDGIYESVSVKLEGVDIITTNDIIWSLRIDGALTGASFATPANHSASEVATEYDTSATAISGGEQIFLDLAGGGVGNQTSASRATLPQLDIPVNSTVTLCATATGTDAAVTSILRDREEW